MFVLSPTGQDILAALAAAKHRERRPTRSTDWASWIGALFAAAPALVLMFCSELLDRAR